MSRTALEVKASRKPKFSSRAYNRCPICGRPRAFMRQFGIGKFAQTGAVRHPRHGIAGMRNITFESVGDAVADAGDAQRGVGMGGGGHERKQQEDGEPGAHGRPA